MIRTTLKLIACSTVAVAALSLAGCKKNASAAGMAARPPAAVTVVPATVRDVPLYIDQIGRIVAMDVVSVMPQVGGKIIAAPVEDGADVKKGQLLFELDPRPFQAALASSEAMAAETRATLKFATTEFNRFKGLLASNAVSQNEFEDRRTTLDVSTAKLAAAEAAVDTAKLNLEYTKILSPIDGRAGAKLIVPGNVVKPGDALLVIQRLNPIYAEFTITENDLGTVRKFIAGHGIDLGMSPEKGLKVEVDVPGDSRQVLAALGPMPKPPATQPTTAVATSSTLPTSQLATQQAGRFGPRIGELVFLDNAVQDNAGTVKLRAILPNDDRYFWPGQFVQCRLILTNKKDAILIPVAAQQIGQMGSFVFVVGADSTAELRPIVAGQRQDDMLVVEKGLTAGEKVILTGQMMVQPNAKVMVMGGARPGQ